MRILFHILFHSLWVLICKIVIMHILLVHEVAKVQDYFIVVKFFFVVDFHVNDIFTS
jgi:hypothetical protein